jgi:hypothetical protein
MNSHTAEATQPVEAGAALVWLRAAFTRLLPSSGQPFYGWLASPTIPEVARFSGLQGAEFNPQSVSSAIIAFVARA